MKSDSHKSFKHNHMHAVPSFILKTISTAALDKGRDSILKTNIASSLNICSLLLFFIFRTSTQNFSSIEIFGEDKSEYFNVINLRPCISKVSILTLCSEN
jgi:hypothetical protein